MSLMLSVRPDDEWRWDVSLYREKISDEEQMCPVSIPGKVHVVIGRWERLAHPWKHPLPHGPLLRAADPSIVVADSTESGILRTGLQ